MESSLFLMRMIGPAMAVAAVMLIVTMLAPLFLYVLARWRANREPVNDNQVGLKFALHYFSVSAFQLALFGGALLLYTMISPGSSDAKSVPYRMAIGMLMPAGIVLGAHMVALKRTNDDAFHNVRRLFLGFNLIITGIVGFVGLVAGCQALFAKGSTGGMGHMAASIVLVYGTGWVMLGWRLSNLIDDSRAGGLSGGLGGPPVSYVPPAPPAPAPPAAAAGGGGALPPLGGGSYPPIEPK